VKGKANRWIFSALKKIGQDQHFNCIDFFYAFIIGQKQSGFPLNSRGDLRCIGQADRVTCPNERRGFPQLLVNRGDGKRREKLEVNLISSAREKFLSANGFLRISANVTVEVTACRA